MAAADKARFYLEQCVPELRELESKKIFERKEIQAINRRRSDFEHKLNAPGPSPADWARYLEYELNLDLLRRKRAKRLGAKVTKHSGPRRIFALLERATAKFHGDLGLWMTYLEYAKRQKAYKRINTIWTKVVRLHPTKPELWIEAGRYAYDDQSDMTAARSYMQRGLRFCQKSPELWLAYIRLELDYLAKVSERAKNLGIGQASSMPTGQPVEDEDDNQILLPSATADAAFSEEDGRDLIGSAALQELSKSPALSGAIPIAIFDAAMQALNLKAATDLAAEMFDLAAAYSMPSRQVILDHMSVSLLSLNPSSAACQSIALRLPVILSAMNTADFARALAAAIPDLNQRLLIKNSETGRFHSLSARWIASYLRDESLDSGLAEALRITLEHITSSYQLFLGDTGDEYGPRDLMDGFGEAKEMWEVASLLKSSQCRTELLQTMGKRWPKKTVELESSGTLAVTGTENQ